MKHTEFFKLIAKGGLSSAYILHGDEEYVKEQAVQRVIETIPADLRDFNVTILDRPDMSKLTEACETLPLFVDKKIVVSWDVDSSVDSAKLVEYLKSVPTETILLLVFEGKLAANLSVYKFAVKSEREVLFDYLSASECIKWIMSHAVQAGATIDARTAQIMVQLIGTELTVMFGELNKLVDLVGAGGVITPQAVSMCVKPNMDVRVFDMLELLTYGKLNDGMRALHALLEGGDEGISLSAFLSSRFKLMLEARRGIDAGKSKRDAIAAMEGNRYANEKAYDAARRFTQAELAELISELSDTMYQRISGQMKEDRYIELVLLKHEWRTQPI